MLMPSLLARATRLCVAFLLLVPLVARAQSGTATITGTVTDSATKAPLAGP